MVLTGGQLTLGAIAVAAFFALSGFLIAGSWERSSSWRSFASRRVRRIYPGYLAAVVVSVLAFPFIPTGMELFKMALLQGVPKSPALVSNPFPGFVNLSLWTIPFEAWTYAGIAILGILGILCRPRILFVLLILSIANAVFFQAFHVMTNLKGLGLIIGWIPLWARLFPPIFAGMLLHAVPRLQTWHPLAGILAACGMVVGACIPMGMIVALPTCGVYLLFTAAFSRPWRWAALIRYGDLSYGIYLYSFLIQQIIIHEIGHPVHAFTLLALSFPPAVAAGVASWFLIERPFMATRRPRPAVVSPVIPS